jgi:alpha-ketoglutarate-dependent taurine dioxygenase
LHAAATFEIVVARRSCRLVRSSGERPYRFHWTSWAVPVQTTPLCETFGTLFAAAPGTALADLEPALVRTHLLDSGAVLLRGFALDDASFRAFAAALGGNFIPHGAPHRPSIEGDESLHLADGGMRAIHLHIELGYLPNPPDLIWFRCIVPPKSGGATIACDGSAIARQLSDAARELLLTKKLKYTSYWPPAVWSRYFSTRSREEVTAYLSALPSTAFRFHGERLLLEYFAPALAAGPANGDSIFANSLLHYMLDGYRDFICFHDGTSIPEWLCEELTAISEQLTADIEWQPDDLLLLDNRRVLHGRRAHFDPERKLHVRMQKLAA